MNFIKENRQTFRAGRFSGRNVLVQRDRIEKILICDAFKIQKQKRRLRSSLCFFQVIRDEAQQRGLAGSAKSCDDLHQMIIVKRTDSFNELRTLDEHDLCPRSRTIDYSR